MNKKIFRTTVRVSYEILEIINRDARFRQQVLKNDESINVDVWTNCREAGFGIRFYDWTHLTSHKFVAFGQNRNSDDIVVYAGNSDDFDFRHGTPNDAVYNNSHMFEYNDLDGAAKWVLEFLFG